MVTRMTRNDDWPEALAGFIDARRNEPFAWGSNDCALFAADAIKEMTGVDLAENLRGYTTAQGATRKINSAGGMRNFAAALTEKHHGLAQRGDVVLVEVEGRETFGVVVGNGKWCAPGVDGLVFRPMDEVRVVFGV